MHRGHELTSCHAGQALSEFGESLRQMADVKYALDDNAKQNFLEPLHHLQMKDLKEVMVSSVVLLILELRGSIGFSWLV